LSTKTSLAQLHADKTSNAISIKNNPKISMNTITRSRG